MKRWKNVIQKTNDRYGLTSHLNIGFTGQKLDGQN